MSASRGQLRAVPDKAVRAVAYVRVSKERDGMISPELQMAAIERHCQSAGYEIVETLTDLDLSGQFWKRRQVEQAVAMIEAGAADVLVVWKLSRVARNRKDWVIAVDRVEGVGGRLESATEPMDTTTSSGRFARGMLAELAAFESERLGESWKDAHERRVKQGKPANGKPRYGYKYDKEKGFTPDPVQGPILAELYSRYLSGQSVYSLVTFLNDGPTRPVTGYGVSNDGLWSARTIRRILDQGFGAGFITRHGERLPGIHEPVITTEQWEEYLSRRETRRVNRRTERSVYLLSGLIRCSCGARMNAGLFGSDRTPKYRCKAAAEKRTHAGGYVMVDYVERLLLEQLKEWAGEVNAEGAEAAKMVKRTAANTNKAESLAKQVVKLDGRLDQLTLKMLDGTVPHETYTRLRDDLLHQKKDAESALAAAKIAVAKPPTDLLPELVEDWHLLPIDMRRDFLTRLIDHVEVTPGRPRATVLVHPKW
jgi:site-specific DNA recombinase